ncbi:MAG: hypothetical protein IT210_15640 [Armatimonadetes bacterium]|nr:hypothetical protein [Armatimonadota bacterium]
MFIFLMLSLAAAIQAGNGLEKGFQNPPDSARPHTWWHWVNGNASRAGITADLEAMKSAGIGGAQIFNVDCGLPDGPVPFMSDQWRGLIRHAAAEADRLGLDLCIHNCAGWSSSGGPWIRPGQAMQTLVWSEKAVYGPARLSETLPQPAARLGYYRDIALLAFRIPPGEAENQARRLRIDRIQVKAAFDRADRLQPDLSPTPPGLAVPRSGIVNLTGRMTGEGNLAWDVPAGEWVILRIGHTPTGAVNAPSPESGRGLECDKLSREALRAHWNGMMAAVLRDLGPLAGRVLNNSLIDSYEVGCQNWTPRFREEFRRRRGYDLLPFLPIITGRVVDSIAISERFLWDFRRTIADLYADNYFGYFGELCRRHGMQFSVEPYGNGIFDNLQCGGLADIPMGEFWVGGWTLETAKLAASAAHARGRKVAGAESFTADDQRGRWLADPYSIKALGDLAFSLGINRYIFHRYAHQPWMNVRPGLTMGPWGTHLERTLTWWGPGSAWLKYVARCQHLLQSGRFIADACYYYGQDAPNDLPGRNALRPELPQGHDYDGCDASALLNEMSVRNGFLTLKSGMRYRVLVLPESRVMTPAVLRKLRDLVRAGATIVGPKPAFSPSLAGYPDCDAKIERLAREVWGDCDGKRIRERRSGKGRVVWGKPLQAVFAEMGVRPDFRFASPSPDTQLVYIHRQAAGADIYFVSNQQYRPVQAECTFRIGGKAPELWHPDTGRTETAPVYREQGGVTTIPLRFDPAGSVFVVFRRSSQGTDHLISVARSGPSVRQPRPGLQIRKAFYEAADGRGADVTATVSGLVAKGQYSIPATNALFGDPTPMVVKRLRVEYTLNGKLLQKTVAENETLDLARPFEDSPLPDFALSRPNRGLAEILPWQPGRYTFRTVRGRVVQVNAGNSAEVLPLKGSWMLRFPAGWGAPPQVRLGRLISWTQHSHREVRYFSGTAEYTKKFFIPPGFIRPGRAVYLDLGRVKNLAEVRLNGRKLGTLWKVPFRLDITGLARPGLNRLSVKVTNLWPNRLIGDEQLPGEVEWNGNAIKQWPRWAVEGKPRPKSARYTFTTWRFYRKDSPLLESGLLGPVSLRSVKTITIR